MHGSQQACPHGGTTNAWSVLSADPELNLVYVPTGNTAPDYYGGTRRTYGASATFRFNEKFSLSPRYDFNRIEHPSADFNTHVGSMRVAYNFSERLLTSALVQYNSLDSDFSDDLVLGINDVPGALDVIWFC